MFITTRIRFVDDSDGSPVDLETLCQNGTGPLPITDSQVSFGLNDESEMIATITHSVTV